MLVSIFKNHNNQVKALIGEQFAARTHIRYETSFKHTIAFLQWKFGVKDIDITKINHAFIADYDFYLRSIKKCNNNTTIKYLKNFGKVIRPIGCGKTTLIHLMKFLYQKNYSIKPCRDIAFEFIHDGFEVVYRYSRGTLYHSC